MGSLFKKPKVPKVKKEPTENKLLAAYLAMQKAGQRAGQKANVLTSSLGVTNAPVTFSTALGGSKQ